MKNTIYKNILIAAIALYTANSYADNIHVGDNNYYEINRRYFTVSYSDCVSEYITKLGTSTSLAGACHQDQKLELSWKTQNYPNLKENPRRVQYWTGSYSKVIATSSTYLRELVDTCRGRIISKNKFVKTVNDTVSYGITNVNLDTSISESFMLVPMTESEANQELNHARKNCLE